MRIVHASSTNARRWRLASASQGRAPRLERLGLAVTSLVLILGLWLTYLEQTATFGTAEADLRNGGLINLKTVGDESALIPHLTMFTERAEKTAVASAVYWRVHGAAAASAIEHVGVLASVTVPAQQVRLDTRLAVLNGRLRTRPDATDIAVFDGADIGELKRTIVVRTPDQFRRRVAIAVALFMLAFWSAHLVRWYFGTTGDPLLLPIAHLLTGLGVLAMLALRDPLRDTVAAATVAGGIAAGCALWVALAFVDFENPRLRRAVLGPLTAAVGLAIALLVFGSGPTGSGARVNLLGFQPVELVRLLVVFSLAAYFARRWQFLRELSVDLGATGPSTSPRARRVRRWIRLPRWKDVRPLAVSITALLALFFLQRDLGPALVLSCVFLGLYGVSRARVALVVAGFAVLATGFGVGYVLGVPSTVTRRVAIALDPWENALPGGDQISHALWALSSGGPWGLGPGVGEAQVIPAGHTDLVMAALGEELGYIGFATVAVLFAILVWRLLRISVRAPGDYTAFLSIGLTLALAVQGLVIVAGMLGLLPLAGVVTPFLSYGRSAMLSNFVALGVCATIARRRGPEREGFAAPVRVLGWTLAVAAIVIVVRAADVQVVRADTFATRANLTQQADGGYRYQYNPRLASAARGIVRGTIFDRDGLPIASSRPEEIEKFAAQYKKLNLDVPDTCRSGPSIALVLRQAQDDPEQRRRVGAGRERCYPLGSLAFHVLGDATRQTNWAASNASYIEKDFDARLKGFDDRPQTIAVTNPRSGTKHAVVRRDYSELLPLVRHKGNPGHADVRRILARDRNLRVTIDAGLQARTARALRDHAGRAGAAHGAAVVIEPATGDLLAAASYPWPDPSELAGERPIPPDALLDRARYGLYPPGSTFKLVTAVAALRTESAVQHARYQCVRLSDGRVGGRVRGASRPVRDDPLDHAPHGAVDMHRAFVVSCNAYFSNLANLIGPQILSEVASEAQIAAARAPAAVNLRDTLPYAGYGQGDVLASPLRMAGVAGALAAGGMLREVRVTADRPARSAGTQWITTQGAAQIRNYMREVVTAGTGRVLAAHQIAIAGKTGTAEVDGERSHSWFVGFAPFTGKRRIAFAVIVEHAGYGARVAAPVAGDIVSAAHTFGLLQ
jgi:cell division protein FtsW (lipid II flippase)/cell division protein FtsI/penicillin-binding protein 2